MNTGIVQGTDSFFTFRLGAELLAVNAANVSRIAGLLPVTKVPDMPHFVEGIVSLEGEVLPVFDGRSKFGMGDTERNSKPCMIFLSFELEGHLCGAGLVVDSVGKVFKSNGLVALSPEMAESYNPEYVAGMIDVDGKAVALLDIVKVFAREAVCRLK